MGTLMEDIRYGVRMLVKNPGFTAIAVLTLALGIGANTAIFSLIDAVMLRSLPVQAPQRLVVFSWTAHSDPKYHSYSNYGDCGQSGGGSGSGCSFSIPLFDQMRSQANVFSGLTAFAGPMQFDLSGNGPASMVRGEIVSGEYFSTLGVNAAAGRLLLPVDDSPSAPAALVLSYSYWQSAFGGDPTAIGRTIRLNNVPFSVVGVASQHFTNLAPGKTQDFWLPLAKVPGMGMSWFSEEVRTDAQTWWVVLLGRLKPGVSIGEAQAAATSIFRNEMLHGAKPLENEADSPAIVLTPAPAGLTGRRGSFSTLLYVLMCAVGLVLLIACANVAGLMLARSAARTKEMAVRLALGAGRLRIARQLLTESLMLSVAGGMLGILLAYWGVDAISALISGNDEPFPFIVAPDLRLLAFTVLISVLTGLLFGVGPALRSARVDLTPALKGSSSSAGGSLGRGGRRLHLGEALVVAQVSLSILVLIGAGLLVRTLHNLRDIDAGFESRNLLLFGVNPTLSGYRDAQIQSLYRNLQDSFAALPGVESVSYSSSPLLSGYLMGTDLHLPGKPEKSNIETDILDIGPGFFATMHVPLLAGRTFTSADFTSAAATDAAAKAAEQAAKKTSSGAPSVAGQAPLASGAPIPVIVNEAFARKFFGGKNALGQHLDDSEDDNSEPAPKSAGYQIIGVAANTKYNDLRREVQPAVFRPLTEGGASFELRSAGDPAGLVPMVRDIVNWTDSNLPLFAVHTQSAQIEQLLVQERLIARLSSFFGVLAVALACIGLYGLLSYEVSRRTREIGIRMALGAQRSQVLRLVVRQGIILALVGGVCGVAGAFGVTHYLASLLYGIHPTDPVTFAAVAILLFVVGLAACYFPARRATKVDPMVALRYE